MSIRAAETSDSGEVLEWQVSYQEDTYGAGCIIKDIDGRCLSPTNLDDPRLPAGDIFKGSTVVGTFTAAGCDGSEPRQRNAPADIEDPASLRNAGEK